MCELHFEIFSILASKHWAFCGDIRMHQFKFYWVKHPSNFFHNIVSILACNQQLPLFNIFLKKRNPFCWLSWCQWIVLNAFYYFLTRCWNILLLLANLMVKQAWPIKRKLAIGQQIDWPLFVALLVFNCLALTLLLPYFSLGIVYVSHSTCWYY